MNLVKDFRELTKFELGLWIASVVIVSASFLFAPEKDWLSLSASLIGVTALIFVAKGRVSGLILSVIFAVFYGIVSMMFRYYGEMITYLFMSAPMSIISIIEWCKNPYNNSQEVKVSSVTKKQIAVMLMVTAAVTVVFYFLLGALGTANLMVSTFSITTSFLAAYLTYLRSPYYAIGYSINDVVLIILWILASMKDSAYIPMIFCFLMFLFNDLYGFVNWQRMKKRQAA